jgi:hypothetical protein
MPARIGKKYWDKQYVQIWNNELSWYILWSNVELQLSTNFESSLVIEQVWSMNSKWRCCNIFEQNWRVFAQKWHVEFATQS